MARPLISLGAQCGEGWMLVGEMRELMRDGVKNIVCLQPFGCLPNHIVGKGMMKPLRQMDPEANIVAIDYDPGASQVNQLNRIKLMMANAAGRMEEDAVPVPPAVTELKIRELVAAAAMSAGAAASNKAAAAAVAVAEVRAQMEYKTIRAKERAMEKKEDMEHYVNICFLKKCW